ncbi:MAG TPA: hypothetical protein VL983_05925 [Terriglobales bacterium]|nr:hypothetical protein [Terriglobales bacterium]
MLVTSLSKDFSFSEQCQTTLVNAHGCGLISPRPLLRDIQVRVEIASAKRYTRARVAEVVPLGGDPETWLVGLELEIPGNFWGIEYAPTDWKIEEGPAEAPRPAVPEPAKQEGPSRRWRLTDMSTGACYLESASPFAEETPVLMSVRVREQEYVLEGVVRATHAQTGMGVVFTQSEEHRAKVEQLIGRLAANREVPKIFVGRKEGRTPMSREEGSIESETAAADPLRELVLQGAVLSAEQFLSDLRAQRLGKRRDPRIEIALPVLLSGIDVKGRPLDQRVMTVNISRRGALLEGIHGVLSERDEVSLTRGRKKEQFRVTRVMNDDSGMGARVGVAAIDPNSTFWDEVLEAASQSGLEAASLRGGGQA